MDKIEVKNLDKNNVANLMETTTGATLRLSKPDPPGADFGAFHPGPRRQYIFDLAGHEEVEFSGGEKITLNPGDIKLIEDLAPTKGHRNRNLGPEDRLVLWVRVRDDGRLDFVRKYDVDVGVSTMFWMGIIGLP